MTRKLFVLIDQTAASAGVLKDEAAVGAVVVDGFTRLAVGVERDLQIILGAICILISSWKRSLHAYGMKTCETLVLLRQPRHSKVPLLKLAMAMRPHRSQTGTRPGSPFLPAIREVGRCEAHGAAAYVRLREAAGGCVQRRAPRTSSPPATS